jgi:hypothetical protein
MREREAANEEEAASVRGVPYVCVEAGGDEFVLRVHSEVDSEEVTEGVKAVKAYVGAEDDGQDADKEERCCVH